MQVSGTRFGTAGTGAVVQCIQTGADGTEACSDNLATFTTTGTGGLGPINVTVTKNFTGGGAPQTCPGLFGPCTLFAAMNAQPQKRPPDDHLRHRSDHHDHHEHDHDDDQQEARRLRR